MAKTFLDYWNELIGYVGEGLDPSLAKTLVQRAHKDILESRTWSFLTEEGVLNAPQRITSGTISVDQFSTTVTADATAKAALDAVTLDIPLGTRQFRVSSTGRIYNIASYDSGAGVLTLKEPFSESSVTGSAYSVFKCFYEPPTPTDFLRFLSVRDLVNSRPLRLNVKKADLDERDPQRVSVEPPVLLSSYKMRSDGVPLFELWPIPSSARGYVCLYCRRGTVLEEDTDTLPASIPEELLMSRAQYHVAKWAEMAKGRDESLRSTDWRFVMGESLARYNELLLKAKKQDDEIFLQNVWMPKRRVFWPPSASWLQEHDWPLVR